MGGDGNAGLPVGTGAGAKAHLVELIHPLGLVVAGEVSYYANSNAIEGVTLDLVGDLVDSTSTDVVGTYSFSGLWLEINVSVTPVICDVAPSASIQRTKIWEPLGSPAPV